MAAPTNLITSPPGRAHAPAPSPRFQSLPNRYQIRIALALAFTLSLPTLAIGLFADDYSMILLIEHKIPGPDRSFDLYRFSDGTPESLARYVDRGPFPWWSVPHLKLAFWRPLSSMLLLGDHALFGRQWAGYHLHSILWYLLFVFAAALVLRRVLAPPVLALALVLFSVHDSHAMAAGWISNRHSEVAAALSLFGLWAHMRAREQGWRWGWPLSLALYALGLTASETALATLGYLVAYELVGRSDAPARKLPSLLAERAASRRVPRLAALAPATLLVAGYLLLYKTMGYGTWGSGSYIDPISEPAAFLRAAPARIITLVGGFFGAIPADMIPTHPELAPMVLGAGLIALPLFGWLLRQAMKNAPTDEKRAVRWLITGGLVSLIPTIGGLPGNRLLLLPSLAGVAVLAIVVTHGWRARGGSTALRFALGALIIMEVIRPPIAFLGTFAYFRKLTLAGEKIAREIELPPTMNRDVAVLCASDMLVAFYAATTHLAMAGHFPRTWWLLSMAAHDHDVRRTGDNTLELDVRDGHMLERTMETLMRDPRAHPLAAGDVTRLDGMTVRVLAAEGGGATRIEARFDKPLDEIWLLAWKDGGLRHVTLPELGKPLRITRELGPLEQY